MDLQKHKQSLFSRKPEKNIHTYDHQIVKEVCEYLNTPKEFPMWLGVVRRIGAGELRAKLDYMKEKGIKNPRYLAACCRKQPVDK